MKLDYTKSALGTLDNLPLRVRRAFFKQIGFLLQNLHHPSLRAKKYSEAEDLWQGRVNRGWRFYFKIVNDTYIVVKIIPHPK
jgi:mRNA interferase RelE/StbE